MKWQSTRRSWSAPSPTTLPELPFALAPISSEEEKAGLLPNLDWAVARVQKAPKSELVVVHDKVMDRIRAMAGMPGSKPMNPQVLMRQLVSYYDPACHAIANLPPLDFDAFTANLSNFETNFRAGHAQ